MSRKIYLHMLFFCGVFFQGIFATLSDKDTRSSSDLLSRKRRVIDHSPGGQHETVNYIVNIRLGYRVICGGAILSHHTVITAAACIQMPGRGFKVLSGEASGNQWSLHNITSVEPHFGNHPLQPIDGIALLTVDPPFVFNRNTGYIQLYLGPLSTGTQITIFDWEQEHPDGPEQNRLRRVTIPILNHEECVNLYRHRFDISQKHICTVCTLQYRSRREIGGPLVINNRLAGIHTRKGELPGQLNPDIYVNLQLPSYSQWIRENTH